MYFNKISTLATFFSKVQTGTSTFFLYTKHLEVVLINEGLPSLSIQFQNGPNASHEISICH